MNRKELENSKRIVIKVGTTTLTHKNGSLNFREMTLLSTVVADLVNSGKEIILVSSGAIGAGMSFLGYEEKPRELEKKQAAAAVGQAVLMELYRRFFSSFNRSVGQILLTKDVFISPVKKKNAKSTLETLLKAGIVPILNENDPISTDEIQEERFGDNDTLSAMVALLAEADLLILLTDVDGLYDCNPNKYKEAKLFSYITELTEEIRECAEDSDSALGTGGMSTKIQAATIAGEKQIPTAILNSNNLGNIYYLLEGKEIGTLFALQGEQNE